MARVSVIKTNFTSGELSPRLIGRVDITRYANGARTIRNAYVLVHGGVKRRQGLRFSSRAKNATKQTRLAPYIRSRSSAYMLEFGETYIRFNTGNGLITLTPQAITNITQANPAVVTYAGADTFANGDRVIIQAVVGMVEVNNREFVVANLNAGANTFELQGVNSTGYTAYVSGGTVAEIYEIAAPWDDTELDDVHYVQGADTMFLAHPSYPMRKLVRYGDTDWKLSAVTFEVPPSEEIGERPTTTLSLSATSGGAVTATAGANAFEASDVGRYLESSAGRGQITGYTSGTQVTVNIAAADAFASVGPIAANAWKITESPKTTLTPSATGPEGATITLTAGAAAFKNLAANVHVGSYIEVNGGLVEVTVYTDTTHVNGIVRTELASVTAAPSGAWSIRQVQWNSLDGYPRAVSLYEQRLIAGGSIAYPNMVWGSRSGEYFNFADGVDDADAFTFALASDQVNPIEHLASTRVLLPLTYGGEFSMAGGVEKPITPTNVQAKLQTVYGTGVPRPVRVGNEIIFVSRDGKKIRALGYRVESDSFNAPDISILSEHITGDGILELAYQQEPDQLVWMVRADGALVSLSIDRDQDVVGFASSDTAGEFESVASMPFNDSAQLWAVVVRTISGQEVRYIERFELGRNTDSCVTGAVTENTITGAVWAAGVLTITRAGHGYATGNTIRLSGFTPDAINDEYEITVTGANTYTVELEDDPGAISVLGTDAKATVSWSGFMHLTGEVCDVVADGYVAAQEIVSASGTVTLDKAAYSIELGKHYDTTIETLPPEVPTGQGTAQGNAMSIHEIIVRVHETKGGKINGQAIPAREFGPAPVLNQPVPSFTGDVRVSNLGWGRAGGGDSDGSVLIEQDQPLDMQILAVITRLTVNDG